MNAFQTKQMADTGARMCHVIEMLEKHVPGFSDKRFRESKTHKILLAYDKCWVIEDVRQFQRILGPSDTVITSGTHPQRYRLKLGKMDLEAQYLLTVLDGTDVVCNMGTLDEVAKELGSEKLLAELDKTKQFQRCIDECRH